MDAQNQEPVQSMLVQVKSHTGVTWLTEYRSSRDLNRPGEPADWPNGVPIFAPELGSLSDLGSD